MKNQHTYPLLITKCHEKGAKDLRSTIENLPTQKGTSVNSNLSVSKFVLLYCFLSSQATNTQPLHLIFSPTLACSEVIITTKVQIHPPLKKEKPQKERNEGHKSKITAYFDMVKMEFPNIKK